MGINERINVSLQTDQGLVRDHNEDYVTCWEPQNDGEATKHGWLYIVADGVGGADAGEVASQFASERVIAHYLATSETKDWGRRLIDAMQAANTDLRQMVMDRNENKRMATTMVAAVIQGRQALIGNVGDSRGYHWHNGRLRQITKDQSLVAKLVEEGAISEAEAVNHPHKNVILYSIGSERSPKMDLFRVNIQPDDAIILCSDGLTRHVADEEIGHVLENEPPTEAATRLIAMANSRGGQDNISVGILRFSAQPEEEVKTAVLAITAPASQTTLLLYTFLLSIVQTILILLVWYWLRV